MYYIITKLANSLKQIGVTLCILVISPKVFSQLSFVGTLKVDAGSSQCYTASSSYSTTGYCWSVTTGSIDNTNCGGIIPMTMQTSSSTKTGTMSPNVLQPPPGSCGQPA